MSQYGHQRSDGSRERLVAICIIASVPIIGIIGWVAWSNWRSSPQQDFTVPERRSITQLPADRPDPAALRSPIVQLPEIIPEPAESAHEQVLSMPRGKLDVPIGSGGSIVSTGYLALAWSMCPDLPYAEIRLAGNGRDLVIGCWTTTRRSLGGTATFAADAKERDPKLGELPSVPLLANRHSVSGDGGLLVRVTDNDLIIHAVGENREVFRQELRRRYSGRPISVAMVSFYSSDAFALVTQAGNRWRLELVNARRPEQALESVEGDIVGQAVFSPRTLRMTPETMFVAPSQNPPGLWTWSPGSRPRVHRIVQFNEGVPDQLILSPDGTNAAAIWSRGDGQIMLSGPVGTNRGWRRTRIPSLAAFNAYQGPSSVGPTAAFSVDGHRIYLSAAVYLDPAQPALVSEDISRPVGDIQVLSLQQIGSGPTSERYMLERAVRLENGQYRRTLYLHLNDFSGLHR